MHTHKRKALLVVSSHRELGEIEKATGFCYETLAMQYWGLLDYGFDVDIASIDGGRAPANPAYLANITDRSKSLRRFLTHGASVGKVDHTLALADVNVADYTMVVLIGGYGALWDFAPSTHLAYVVSQCFDEGILLGAVGEGVAGLTYARLTMTGCEAPDIPVADGRQMTCFSDAELEAAGLLTLVPFSLQKKLTAQGAKLSFNSAQAPCVRRDGDLVTGQNAASADLVVQALLQCHRERFKD
ncbi:MAG: type 1 glutamine amidotransferase domain-containing protein [Neisseriaceae bacterium]|nr:type 1 glutamine amidotransferase domain-containing protein [Neisseriaceae bacterium]MBP6863335.1 type 1 glutamine amidotransferase domain-containing protein [Neisseriaceae bacterium]